MNYLHACTRAWCKWSIFSLLKQLFDQSSCPFQTTVKDQILQLPPAGMPWCLCELLVPSQWWALVNWALEPWWPTSLLWKTRCPGSTRAGGCESIQLSVCAIGYLSVGMLCFCFVATKVWAGLRCLNKMLKMLWLSLIKVFKKSMAKLVDAMIILQHYSMLVRRL